MAIKVIAQRRNVKLGKNPGMKFVMRPDLYIPIAEKKVFSEASTHSGISAGVIKAAWDAAGEVLRTWATEGHSVPLPGLGTMRFGVRSKAVEELEDVKTKLIKVRRIIFTPSVEVKDELKNTSIQITCLDEDGNVLKRVTSGDSGDIEEDGGEHQSSENTGENENENEGSQNGSQSENQNENQGGSQNQTGNYALTISKSGTGSSTVKDAEDQDIASGAEIASGASVNVSIVPAEGQVPTATINGSSIPLTKSGETYSGSFEMPEQASTLVIDSGTVESDQPDNN